MEFLLPIDLSSLPDPDREANFYQGVTFKRFIAWCLDAALIFVLCLLVLPFTAFLGIFFFGALYLTIGFLYRWSTLARGSATWGMRLMAIELRDEHGQRFDTLKALLHVTGHAITIGMFPLVLISAGLMLLRGRGQGLTDLILRTAMINRPAQHL